MRALGALAFAGLVFGLVALALVLSSDHDTIDRPFLVLAFTLGWAFIGTGLYALWRRPGQLIGRLMVGVGFAWFLNGLPESDLAPVFTVGLALSGLWTGALIHLLLAFPSGRTLPGLETAPRLAGLRGPARAAAGAAVRRSALSGV